MRVRCRLVRANGRVFEVWVEDPTESMAFPVDQSGGLAPYTRKGMKDPPGVKRVTFCWQGPGLVWQHFREARPTLDAPAPLN